MAQGDLIDEKKQGFEILVELSLLFKCCALSPAVFYSLLYLRALLIPFTAQTVFLFPISVSSSATTNCLSRLSVIGSSHPKP